MNKHNYHFFKKYTMVSCDNIKIERNKFEGVLISFKISVLNGIL